MMVIVQLFLAAIHNLLCCIDRITCAGNFLIRKLALAVAVGEAAMNSETSKWGEILPARTPRSIGDVMMDIVELRAEAIAGAYNYLAYFLDMALTEAEIQSERGENRANAASAALVLANAPAPVRRQGLRKSGLDDPDAR